MWNVILCVGMGVLLTGVFNNNVPAPWTIWILSLGIVVVAIGLWQPDGEKFRRVLKRFGR